LGLVGRAKREKDGEEHDQGEEEEEEHQGEAFREGEVNYLGV
jgi:hypothetical protein